MIKKNHVTFEKKKLLRNKKKQTKIEQNVIK